MLKWLTELPRPKKRLITIVADLFISVFSLWAAFSLRFDGPVALTGEWWPMFVAAPLATIPVFIRMGLYRSVVRHFSLYSIGTISLAAFLATVIWGIAALFYGIQGLPRSVIAINWFILSTLAVSSRLVMNYLFTTGLRSGAVTRVAIFGSGREGAQFARALQGSENYQAMFFLDENAERRGEEIAGLRVYPLGELGRLLKQHRVTEILITVPLSDPGERLRLFDVFSTFPVRIRLMPPMAGLVEGNIDLQQFSQVRIEDLLGRSPVPPDRLLLEAGVRDRCVLVTGAGGSIGSQLCAQIHALAPRILLLIEQSEYALFEINRRLAACARGDGKIDVVPLLGSVEDAGFIADVLAAHRVDVVFHAAAYKHVPIVEENVIVGVRNNVFGTRVVAEQAAAAGVDRFVLISTDKAVRPTSIMGASKRLAEMVLQALAARAQAVTCFCIVRFGNVLDSSGSVIPLFREQIDRDRELTVTHPEAERYFMTINEAVELTMQAGAMAENGDVLLLDMGKPVNIAEMARKMIHLRGLRAKEHNDEDGDVKISYTGLRPGEKLREELLTAGDALCTRHPKIMRAQEPFLEWRRLQPLLDRCEQLIIARDAAGLCRLLKEAVPSYRGGAPQDLLWKSLQQSSPSAREPLQPSPPPGRGPG